MGEATWEMCSAETLLEQFFAQDDLGKLTVSTGELLSCPLLVLDDTFHVAAHYLPLGFSDELFQIVTWKQKMPCAAARSPMKPA